MSRAAALAGLVRPRLLPSAACDVLAGVALAGGIAGPTTLARALVCSLCLYAAGMVFNDVADAGEDARLGRDRPIPTGRVARLHAGAFGLALVGLALLAAPWSQVGLLPIWITAGVLFYDFAAKRLVLLGAPTLGACRALNVSLGWAATGAGEPTTTVWVVLASYATFVALAVVHGQLEDRGAQTSPARSTAILLSAASIAFLPAFVLPYCWLTALAAVATLVRALRAPANGAAWIAWRTGVLLRGLSLFMLAVALGAGGWWEAAAIGILALCVPLLVRHSRSWS